VITYPDEDPKMCAGHSSGRLQKVPKKGNKLDADVIFSYITGKLKLKKIQKSGLLRSGQQLEDLSL